LGSESSDLPSLEEISAWAGASADRFFVEFEFGRGLDYYLRRVDRLLLSGKRALDAGCGMGQWSLALARRYEEVDALDLDERRLAVLQNLADRLAVSNVRPRAGSVEELPYEAERFDCVFCYGVIMFTDLGRTLAEFARVLRPSGRLYLCLNADGFARSLVEGPRAADPAVRRAGQETLYNTFWRRALAGGLEADLRAGLGGALATRPESRLVARLKDLRVRMTLAQERILDAVLRASPAGRTLLNEVAAALPAEHLARLRSDAAALAREGTAPRRETQAEAHRPHEVEPVVRESGLVGFEWAYESGLVCDLEALPVEPKYEGVYDADLAVWEFLATKPEAERADGPEHFAARATRARDEPVYRGAVRSPVLSNGARWTYPAHLLEEARHEARARGPGHLGRLARALGEGAGSPEAAVERLLRFVQDALYRDPVAQPLEADGSLPDALTILCSGRGRCGHAARLLAALARELGLEARPLQLERHVVAEVRVRDRWLVADADAFKYGVVLRGRDGRLPSFDEIRDDPLLVDRFPATGWALRPGSRFTRDVHGRPVRGYVDALEPDARGHVSGYFVPAAAGHPPSIPHLLAVERSGSDLRVAWSPSRAGPGRLVGYRLHVGTRSRGWSYDDPGPAMALPLPSDLAALELPGEEATLALPSGTGTVHVSVVAVGDRVEREPETWFWPSEEGTA